MTALLLPLLPFLLLTSPSLISVASDDSNTESFLECLHDKSQPSFPISGAIYTQTNSSFNAVLQAYIRDLRFNGSETPKPIAIVAATHVSHVQAVVLCCKSQSIQIRIRSGGHNFEGLSYVSPIAFVVLDLFNLNKIDVNVENRTAFVQAGAILGELYYQIANISNHTLAFPAGVCPTIGVGGHFSGGGYGNLMRKYGLAADNVIDAEVVDAKGRLMTRTEMGEGLFWATTGGGGSSFCVVVSWTITLVPVPRTVTVFYLSKTLEQDAAKAVYQWQQVAPNLEEEIFIRVYFQAVNKTNPSTKKKGTNTGGSTKHKLRTKATNKNRKTKTALGVGTTFSGNKTVQATFMALYLGRATHLVNKMKKAFHELGLKLSDCTEMTWIESVLFFAHFPKGMPPITLQNRKPYVVTYGKRKSDFMKIAMSMDALNKLWEKLMEVDPVIMEWSPMGGKMATIHSSEKPYPWRAGFINLIEYCVFWLDPEKAVADHNLASIRKLYYFMTPYVSSKPRSSYLNYVDLDIGNNSVPNTDYNRSIVYGRKYFGPNLDRLMKVKLEVDPENLFNNEVSIAFPKNAS